MTTTPNSNPWAWTVLLLALLLPGFATHAAEAPATRQTIKALYIPLAMDMYRQKPGFRWVGLMHRDGNALAINDLLNKAVQLAPQRETRLPDDRVAKALKAARQRAGRPTEIGMPHLLSTHTVVLYHYLKKYGTSLSLTPGKQADVLAIAVSPPKSPAFLRGKSNRAQAAAFEQSLPWADIVETAGFGRIAWYSKDVLQWPYGHVECIALASNRAIATKFAAVQEVMAYIRRAGEDIEAARIEGGAAMDAIVAIVRKHIPAHTRPAIIASLDPQLRVINYQHLNIDKPGLQQIMDLAVEGGILGAPIDIDAFADERFDADPGIAQPAATTAHD